nr:hypothetical protein Iba_chr02dCG1910 [Ipomoea batatas]
MAAATASASFSQVGLQQEASSFLSPLTCPWIGSIALHVNSPVVKVPVLSNAIVWQEASASRTCPPLRSAVMELEALIAVTYANGAAANAHGDAATISPSAL